MTVTSGHHGFGTLGFGSLGGIQGRNLLSSSTVHQRIMFMGLKPLVEKGGGMAFTFSLEGSRGQLEEDKKSQTIMLLKVNSFDNKNASVFVG